MFNPLAILRHKFANKAEKFQETEDMSRRDFLKLSAITSGVILAGGVTTKTIVDMGRNKILLPGEDEFSKVLSSSMKARKEDTEYALTRHAKYQDVMDVIYKISPKDTPLYEVMDRHGSGAIYKWRPRIVTHQWPQGQKNPGPITEWTTGDINGVERLLRNGEPV